MINISSADKNLRIASQTVTHVNNVAPPSTSKKEMITGNVAPGVTALSTLSRQLAESAVRAQARDQNLDRHQLGLEAERMMMELVESGWREADVGHVVQLPDTTDPELLERARQASEYIAPGAHRNHGIKNPFAGLSREQLTLIVYDEKGSYTQHERRAAHRGVMAIEDRWNHSLWGPERFESAANNGRTPKFYTEILGHYRSLPLIEQSRYPDNYESRLEGQIAEANNPMPSGKKDNFHLMSLFELMAHYGFPWDKEEPGILDIGFDAGPSAAPDESIKAALKTNSLSPDASPNPVAAGRS